MSAFHDQAGSSSRAFRDAAIEGLGRSGGRAAPNSDEPSFEIFEWYPHLQSCHKYFLDHAQHSDPVQALAAFVNIILPCQKDANPVTSSTSSPAHSAGPSPSVSHPRQMPNLFASNTATGNASAVSVIPYVRRLVATGFDTPAVLHGFFGDSWATGIGPLHEIERRNFLFAAKSSSWLRVKSEYDMSPNETVPFLKPLQGASEQEIAQAEAQWSDWLAMQDWMVGPRAPDAIRQSTATVMQGTRIKREPRD
ncbi:MAG: hypothetical protein M1818_007265 [Claussenomyces sp. TS43310]|nr:MAG: hypothetical protein M1818_007265 [Claussenomyces sp. TS43310]